ncbi:unnamed protein product [Mytilus coruscus]|uniref:Uncharacterized protein n=1 Tax=Mytilus coruscus TaxID=42192 RepID=A0A6J8EV14_MYTCO|nr:unnamed protein product [Mytilus coruscus]
MDELGNPFIEDSQDLFVLDTKDIAPTSVVDTIRQIEKIGRTQYEKYIEDRLIKRTVPIFEPIKKNRMTLLRTTNGKTVSAMTEKISILKSDVSLFSRLYISCQTRGGDLEDLFENNINPPALSQNGKISLGTKSDLLSKCLEQLTTTTGDVPEVDVLVIDGAAIMNMLKPSTSRTFDDYADLVFCPYIRKHLETVTRVNVVWNDYIDNSLKAATRSKRRKGIRRRVQDWYRVCLAMSAFGFIALLASIACVGLRLFKFPENKVLRFTAILVTFSAVVFILIGTVLFVKNVDDITTGGEFVYGYSFALCISGMCLAALVDILLVIGLIMPKKNTRNCVDANSINNINF